MKFRSQLVASFGRLNNIQISDPDLPGLEKKKMWILQILH